MRSRWRWGGLLVWVIWGCESDPPGAGQPVAEIDAQAPDAAVDGAVLDAAVLDDRNEDAAPETEERDAAVVEEADAESPDAGPVDATPEDAAPDAQVPDAAPPPPAVCGDGVVTADEACDDGNAINDDYCSTDCAVIGDCGDGVVQSNEACDDGDTVGGDYCSADCRVVLGLCGDGIVQDIEACDDENLVAGDYCASDCLEITGECGDGVVQSNEACDDGNQAGDDHCNADCTQVTGACGDGVLQGNETCDDGNLDEGDYCSRDCLTRTGRCGDGIEQTNEACDDGNRIDDGDGCGADCQRVGICGDGVVQAAFEVCDDGNLEVGDFCDAVCAPTALVFGESRSIFDTEWPAGAEVIVEDGATVAVRGALRIGAGVVIRLGTDASISVAEGGRIDALGTADAPIVMTALHADACATQRQWRFLRFNEGSAGLLRFTQLGFATNGLSMNQADVHMTDSLLHDICGRPATEPGTDARQVAAFSTVGADLTLARVQIRRVQAGAGAPGVDAQENVDATPGGRGGATTGINLQTPRAVQITDLTIDGLIAGEGAAGGAGFADRAPATGGDGGHARGIILRDVQLENSRLERLTIAHLAGGAGGPGGRGVPGLAGADGECCDPLEPGEDGAPGGPGGTGGIGGLGQAVLTINTQGIDLVNALIYAIDGGAGGPGGTGGPGGEAGAAAPPNLGGASTRAGAGGPGGEGGRGGVSHGVRWTDSVGAVVHATIVDILPGLGGAAGPGGAGGLGGRQLPEGERRFDDGDPGEPGGVGLDGHRGVAVEGIGDDGVIEVAYSILVQLVPHLGSHGIYRVDGVMTSHTNLVFGQQLPYRELEPGPDDIQRAPAFVDPAVSDFTLRAQSPAIDAAANSEVEQDRTNQNRVPPFDLGALEHAVR